MIYENCDLFMDNAKSGNKENVYGPIVSGKKRSSLGDFSGKKTEKIQVLTNETLSEMPTNSTPIVTDPNTLAALNAKRKQFLNAKLDLTINNVPSQPFKAVANNNNNQTNDKFLVPKVPPLSRTSQKSSQKQPVLSMPKFKLKQNMAPPPAEAPKSSVIGSKNLSRLLALEVADLTRSFIEVEQNDIGNKENRNNDLLNKKDRSRCLIQ